MTDEIDWTQPIELSDGTPVGFIRYNSLNSKIVYIKMGDGLEHPYLREEGVWLAPDIKGKIVQKVFNPADLKPDRDWS